MILLILLLGMQKSEKNTDTEDIIIGRQQATVNVTNYLFLLMKIIFFILINEIHFFISITKFNNTLFNLLKKLILFIILI